MQVHHTPASSLPAVPTGPFTSPARFDLPRLRGASALLALALATATGCHDSRGLTGPLRAPGDAPREGNAPSGCGRLLPDESFEPGQMVNSCNGVATLILQEDHNVVLYDAAGASWTPPNTVGRGTTAFRMQADGNLVASDLQNQALWISGTYGHPGAWLAVQDDCNLVIYRGPFPSWGAVLWESNTPCRAVPPATGRMLPGDQLWRDVPFTSGSGNVKLVVQSDQNVVLYQGSVPLWSAPGTVASGTNRLIMQHDGNLVAVNRAGNPTWATNTGGNPGAWLQLQDDCNLVIYRGPYPQGNGALWATGTPCDPKPLAPVSGPFRVTKLENPQCYNALLPTWTFCQHQGPSHTGTGVGGAHDRYAWDVNLANSADTGKPVYAAAPGRVVKYGGIEAPGGAYGAVLIEHNTGGRIWWSGYLHMTGIQVVLGQEVSSGTVLGYVGNASAYSIPPHLHFVMYNGTNTNGGLYSYDGTFVTRN